MIIIKLKGGLGNQMFQYAAAKAMALRNNVELKLDISFLLRKGNNYVPKTYLDNEIINYELPYFSLTPSFTSFSEIPLPERIKSKFVYDKIYTKLNQPLSLYNFFQIHTEKDFSFDSNIIKQKKGYFDGYFQTEKYFIDYHEAIRNDFIFKEPLDSKNIEFLNTINLKNTISIHVRRGDYLLQKNSFIGMTTEEYYKNAINYIRERIHNTVFVFFSDDIPWVKQNFLLEEETYYVDWNTDRENFRDMQLMSLCKHNIIANSTFSWWGAWLNKNPDKLVIAPERWFSTDKIDYSDVIPDTWIKL